MFEGLSEKLEGALRSLSGKGRITELNIAESMREIRRALLDADVNYQVARDFTERIKEKALGSDVLNSVAPGEQLVKIVYDELVHFLGGTHEEISFSTKPPTVILVAGLQGSGKTTFSAKLANYCKGQGKSPMLVAADVYRPAAVDQLKTLAESIGVPVFSLEDDSGVVQDPVRIAREAVQAARKQSRDILIIDTAGRLHVDEKMMTEITDIKSAVNPSEILFVVDAMTGQDAVNTAVEFNKQLNFDGVVLTKLDGDTRGGAALSIRTVVQKPIKFASTGEKLDALIPFYPDRMARRILGMGDVVSLVEKAQEQFDQVKTYRYGFADLDRAIVDGHTEGFVKIVTRKNGRIVGATVVGSGAGDLILPVVMAMNARMKISKLSHVVYPYPTMVEGVKRAADSYYRERFAGRTGEWLRKVVRWLK